MFYVRKIIQLFSLQLQCKKNVIDVYYHIHQLIVRLCLNSEWYTGKALFEFPEVGYRGRRN